MISALISKGLVLQNNVLLKSPLLDRHFLTWLLIGWRLYCQSTRSQLKKKMLCNNDLTNYRVNHDNSPNINYKITANVLVATSCSMFCLHLKKL